MPSVQSLPPDQRAVLELVLRRGRTYDEIAQLLSIDRAGVRQRALNALDALGPDAGVPAERRALITDYLLGALPPKVTEQVRERLAQSAGERAWARVIAAELEPLSTRPLPEIPVSGPSGGEPPPASTAAAEIVAPPPTRERELEKPTEPEKPQKPKRAPRERPRRLRGRRRREAEQPPGLGPRPPIAPGRERPPSRRAGRMVLIAVAIIALAIILSVALGPSSNKPRHGRTASTPHTTSTSSATTPTTATTGSNKILAQINLKPPSGGSARGVADVLREAGKTGLAIVAQGLTPNTSHNAYAVWLFNSPSDSQLLGFVSPAVGSNGRLQTAGPLPANASRFKQLLVTVETQAKPKTPGTIVLEGTLTGLS